MEANEWRHRVEGSGMTLDALIEAVATALWQQESIRALGRNRLVAWDEWDNGDRNVWRGLARAALAAIEANGFRVAPVDPTPEMIKAASVPWGNEVNFTATEYGTYAPAQWAAMLSAAPKITELT